MKESNFNLIKLEADSGKVFDWADPTAHTIETIDPETEETKMEQEHLYAKTVFLGIGDSVDNYVEVDDPALSITEAINNEN